ncbi:MAG: protein kinase [Selenomonadaceae bacterium]|nr:protein kinase [Selenomonadaceae bacterium]
MSFGAEFLESHYTTESTLSQKQGSRVLLIRSETGDRFVRRELSGDRRALFMRLKSLAIDAFPPIVHILFNGEKTVVVEKFIDGTPLSDCIREKNSPACLPFPDLAEKILAVLQKLHGAGIIHRDLKPEHILLTADGVRLIDFGIARLYSPDADRDTEIRGTRRYAPPEQFGVMQTDPRADLYALSRTLEEILPLTGRNFLEKRLYRAWLAKGAAFDPNARYKSADEMRAALLWRKRAGTFLKLSAALLLSVLLILPLRPLLFPPPSVAPENPPQTEITEPEPATKKPVSAPSKPEPEAAQTKPNGLPDAPTPPESKTADGAVPESAQKPAATPPTAKQSTSTLTETTATVPTPPITTKPQGGVPSLVLANGESDVSNVSLGTNLSAAIHAENQDGTLTLSLSDDAGHSEEYSFSYQKPPRDYPNANRIDAEIHLIDMNGDGVLDVVPVLARRQIKSGFSLIDGASCWSVVCSPTAGFSLADGTAFSAAFKVYPDGITDNDMFVYFVKDGKLTSREF